MYTLAAMSLRMRPNTFSHPLSNFQAHPGWLISIGLVLKIIHITVAAIEITATHYLDNEGSEWNYVLIHISSTSSA
jgi:hypothetical protein